MSEQFTKDLALVGIGYWGKNLARNFHNLGALHTICDRRQETLDQYRDTYADVHFSTSYSDVLQNEQIRRIAIAAPALLHYDLTKQALLADKDVYVEKPLCLDSEEAQELVDLADERGLILMVGHILQFHPCVMRLQELLGRGELGKLQYVTSNRLNLGAIRTEENALWNFAPHDVSVILSLCGHRLPDQVRSVGSAFISRDVTDVSMTTLRFPSEVRAHIYVSWLNPFKEQKLTVVGSAGLAVFDDTKPWEEKLALYRDHVHWSEGYTPQVNNNAPEYVVVDQKEPLKEECAHFLTCCKDRVIPLTDGKEALRVLKVLEAAQLSIDAEGEAINPRLFGADGYEEEGYLLHPTAQVEHGAEIGNGSKIGPYSTITTGARLADQCTIEQHVYLGHHVRLDDNVYVSSHVCLDGAIECERGVSIGPSVVVAKQPNVNTKALKTVFHQGAKVGANATIMEGVDLGQYCLIAAGAVVSGNVKPYARIVGNPGTQDGWVSRRGEILDLPVINDQPKPVEAACPHSGEIYRLAGDSLEVVAVQEEVHV